MSRTSPEPAVVVHFTSNTILRAIKDTERLGGPNGVFVLSPRVAQWCGNSRWRVMLCTGIYVKDPRPLYITGDALKTFHYSPRWGLVTWIRWRLGIRSTPLGSLDILSWTEHVHGGATCEARFRTEPIMVIDDVRKVVFRDSTDQEQIHARKHQYKLDFVPDILIYIGLFLICLRLALYLWIG